MRKYTQKALGTLVTSGTAQDITHHGIPEYQALKAIEGGFNNMGYASGGYGCNGLLLKGWNTGTLYAITRRTSAVYIYG